MFCRFGNALLTASLLSCLTMAGCSKGSGGAGTADSNSPAGDSGRAGEANTDSRARFNRSITRVKISIANPRELGKREYRVIDAETGRQIGFVPSPDVAMDDETVELVIYYPAELIQFVRLIDGDIAVPAVLRPRSQFGLIEPEPIQWERQEPKSRFYLPSMTISVPADDSISRHILYIRSREEETGWRYMEVDRATMKSESLEIPDLLTLPRAEEREDFDALWAKFEAAEADHKEWKRTRWQR